MRNRIFITAVAVIGIAWTVFQLVYNSYGNINYMVLRSVHLGFALVLTFLYPLLKGKPSKAKIGISITLSLISLFAFLYIPLNLDRMLTRMTGVTPLTTLDYITGIIIILVVIEATRITIGKPLVILTLIFLAYGLFGQYLPGWGRHSPVPISRYLDYMVFTTDGIFGTPIYVTSSVVYLFLVFGAFLVFTHAGEFFTDTALALAGRTRGGPAKAAVIASGLVGMVSGSAVANVVTTGVITIPLMKKTGYRPEFAGAVEAVASTGGQLVPPVMGAAAFVMAQLTGISYWRICLAAILPAVLYYAALFMAVDLEAARIGLGGIPADRVPRMRRILLDKGHVALALVVLVYLLARQFSPAIAVFWSTVSLFLLSFIRQSTRLNLKSFLATLESAAKTAVTVVSSCACVGIIIATVTITGIGLSLSSTLTSFTGGNVLALLVILMITSYILGMGMPTTPSYITVAALIVPLLIMAKVPALSAHMFAFYFSLLSMITPPVALAAFAAAGIAGSDTMKTGWIATRLGIVLLTVPFLFVYRPSLLIIGPPLQIIQAFVIALIGCLALAVALEGYCFRQLSIIDRLLWLAGAILVIVPGWQTTAPGLVLLVILFALQRFTKFNFAISRNREKN